MSQLAVLVPRDLPADRFIEFVQRAEAHGFDELWIVEDLGFHGGVAQAAVALAATSRVRIGIGILPAAARNVAFAAMEINTLAGLFPGRLTVGVGHGMRGWMRQVGAWPESPLTLLEETLTSLASLLHGEHLTSSGRYVSLSGVTLHAPAEIVPPVLAGVRGPKSMALAGRVSDGVILAEPVTPEYLEVVKQQLGQDSPTIVAFSFAAIDDDDARSRHRVRPLLKSFAEADWAPHIAPLPFAAEFEALLAKTGKDGFAEALPDAWIDELAIVGSPVRARDRIASLYAAGASCVVLIPVGDPFAALEDFARLL